MTVPCMVLTLASIGASLGYTREWVRQTVKRSGAVMPREYKCAVANCDASPRPPRSYCHAHQVRFEPYGDPLGSKPQVLRLT